MEIRQKTELSRLLVPELRQSLAILSLPLIELKALVEEEVQNNPFLEEIQRLRRLPPPRSTLKGGDSDFQFSLITQKASLQDILLRQLGMFSNTDEEFRIGQEIIGNLDENGYLNASLEEIANVLQLPLENVEKTLKIIQQFDEPAGVAARSIPECLLLQLELANENDPLLKKIVENHLDDVAKKNYQHIAKSLKEPFEKIEPLINKILKLNPKPGRNYSTSQAQRVIPDIIINDKNDTFEININDEDIPTLRVNEGYRKMLKDNSLDTQTKEFLTQKFRNALEILRAISKRKFTLRKIMDALAEIQQDAIREDFSLLKPLTFKDVARKIEMHESTVCRAVMNKYVELPHGIVALKDFFTSHVHADDGESVSSTHIKKLIKEVIALEDKKHPLSDQEVSLILKEKGLVVSRRTVAKYREELKLLSTAFRRER